VIILDLTKSNEAIIYDYQTTYHYPKLVDASYGLWRIDLGIFVAAMLGYKL